MKTVFFYMYYIYSYFTPILYVDLIKILRTKKITILIPPLRRARALHIRITVLSNLAVQS